MRRPLLAMMAVLTLSACAGEGAAPKGGAAVPPPLPERTATQRERDQALAEAVTERVRSLDKAAFRTVDAAAMEGRVLLTGAVVKPEQRRHAERVAAGVAGVVAVRDEIQLVETSFFDRYLPDLDREAALKARLAAEPEVVAANYDVRVVDGVAYLLGDAGSPAEAEHVKEILAADPTVKWVVNAVAVQ